MKVKMSLLAVLLVNGCGILNKPVCDYCVFDSHYFKIDNLVDLNKIDKR